MEQKKYLKLRNKLGFGSGSLGVTMTYILIVAYVMIYMTDTVGLDAGIVGTLVMVSKFTDGVSDIIFGHILDRTKTKWGKARPWMFGAYFGCVVSIIALFSVPTSLGTTAQYVYFFIWYTMYNTVFYTANNISYSTLTSLITRNPNERVQLGSFRYFFSNSAYILLTIFTPTFVTMLGGGNAGWRNLALIYAIIGLVVNSISVFSVRELSEEELGPTEAAKNTGSSEKVTVKESIKLLFTNKYFLILCGIYTISFILQGLGNTGGIYYMTYVLKQPGMLGVFNLVGVLPILAGFVITPILVKKANSVYKVTFIGMIISTIFRGVYTIVGIMQNVPLMLVVAAIMGLFSSPTTATLPALTAATSDYSYKKSGKRIDGLIFSSSSFGSKIGTGLGTAMTGWLLSAAGYVQGAADQPAGVLAMMNVMFFIIPLVGAIAMTALFGMMRVEKANAKLDAEIAKKRAEEA